MSSESSGAPLLLYGAGGAGREVAWLAQDVRAAGGDWTVVGFVDDSKNYIGRNVNDVPVLSIEQASQRFPRAGIVATAGSPSVRSSMIDRALEAGFRPVTLMHPGTAHSQWITIGEGTVICSGCALTTNIKVGRFVQINLNCSISHDAILEDFSTFAPGVHICGWVHVGARAYLGTGAVVINGTEDSPIVIGADAVIGAGACVIRSVPAEVTAVGVPARLVEH